MWPVLVLLFTRRQLCVHGNTVVLDVFIFPPWIILADYRIGPCMCSCTQDGPRPVTSCLYAMTSAGPSAPRARICTGTMSRAYKVRDVSELPCAQQWCPSGSQSDSSSLPLSFCMFETCAETLSSPAHISHFRVNTVLSVKVFAGRGWLRWVSNARMT